MAGAKKKTSSNFKPRGGEAKFIAALKAGEVCDFEGLPDDERTLRGEVLSTILRGERLKGRKTVIPLPRQILIKHAAINGELNLMDVECAFALKIEKSVFLNQPNFERTKFYCLNLEQSDLPGCMLDDAVIKGDLCLDYCECNETLSLNRANIGGHLSLEHAKFFPLSGKAIQGQNLIVADSVFLNNSVVRGRLWFMFATFKGSVELQNASLINLEDSVLILQQAKCDSTLFLDTLPHPPIGRMSFRAAVICDLQWDNLSYPMGSLELRGLRYDRLNFINSSNRQAHWEGWLSPFESSRILQPRNAAAIAALTEEFSRPSGIQPENEKHTPRTIIENIYPSHSKFYPSPWRHYARSLDEHGYEAEARSARIQLARRMTGRSVKRQKNHGVNWIRRSLYRAWRGIFRLVSGYGYAPWRAIIWLVGLWIFGSVMFQLAKPDMTLSRERVYTSWAYHDWQMGDELPAGYPRYNPVIYALDVMLPVVDFAQESHYRPRNRVKPVVWWNPLTWNWWRWYNRLHLAFGWFLSTIAVLGFTGLISDRKEP